MLRSYTIKVAASGLAGKEAFRYFVGSAGRVAAQFSESVSQRAQDDSPALPAGGSEPKLLPQLPVATKLRGKMLPPRAKRGRRTRQC